MHSSISGCAAGNRGASGSDARRGAHDTCKRRAHPHTATAYSGFRDLRMEIWPQTSPWYDPAQAHVYDFNLDQTKKLLAEAGAQNLETELTWRTWVPPDNGITAFRSAAWSDLARRVLSETDFTKQRALAVELDRFLLDEAWFMPVVSLPPKVIAPKDLQGVSFNPHETATYYDAWFA